MPTVDYGARVETTIERIERSDTIHPENKSAIKEFKRDLTLDGMSDAWLSKLAGHLYTIAAHLGDTRFEEIDKDGMKDLVEWIQTRTKENGEPVSDATINAYKQVIKRFWRWLHDKPSGEHPEVTAWINTTMRDGSNGKLPQDLLDRDDVEALKDACRNPRDTAFIAMLYETGARIGELIDLTVGDIEDHRHGRKVVIDGKTGQRRLPLLEASPAINKWLNDHPSPRKDAPLWSQLRNGSKQLSYHYIRQKLLVRAGKRAAERSPTEFAANPKAEELEFHKPLNPHQFRHSRASHLANEFTEAQLCEWFGWVQGSDIPAKYVHLSGRDIDNAYTQIHGLRTEEDEEDQRTVDTCWRCEELNEVGDYFCSRCGAPLDEAAAESYEAKVEGSVKQSYRDADPADAETMDKLDKLDELLEDPEVKTALLSKIGSE